MKRAAPILVVLLGLFSGCSNSQNSRTGIDEPLVIRGVIGNSKAKSLAPFIPGQLPGNILAADAAAPVVNVDGGTPATRLASLGSFLERFVYQGQNNVGVSGTATQDVSSVAFKLKDLGTGYWVMPVGALDVATQKNSWDISADFGRDIPEGYQYLNFVGIDGNGNAGAIQALRVCIAGRLYDGFQGCVATAKPPAAAIALTWDTNVDLDIQVLTPDGQLIEPKNPLTTPLDAGVTQIPAGTGRIDRDSNAACVIDGIREEDLVWATTAPKGTYGIYVNLFDSCKQPVVHFNVKVYTAVDKPDVDAGKQLQSWYSADGILLEFQANGGSSRGYFVKEFLFQ